MVLHFPIPTGSCCPPTSPHADRSCEALTTEALDLRGSDALFLSPSELRGNSNSHQDWIHAGRPTMASSRSKEKEDGGPPPFPAESPTTPSSAADSSKPKRSITPRGPIFSNLNDAHRNITSRLASNNPWRKPSAESHASEETTPLQELSSPVLSHGYDDAEPVGELHRNASEFVSSHLSRPLAGRCLTDHQSILKSRDSALFMEDESRNTLAVPKSSQDSQRAPVDKAANSAQPNGTTEDQQPDASDSTVCRIVAHYATAGDDHMSPTVLGSRAVNGVKNMQNACTLQPPPRSAARLGFGHGSSGVMSKADKEVWRDEKTKASQASKAVGGVGSISEPYGVGLSGESSSGRARNSTVGHLIKSPVASNLNSTRDHEAGWLKGREADESDQGPLALTGSLVPQPLRIPSNKEILASDDTAAMPCRSDNATASSLWTAGVETADQNDPFLFDNDHYRRIRQLGKEREISQALKSMSRSETATDAGLDSLATSPEKPYLQMSSPEKSEGGSPDPARAPYRGGNFFDPVAFRALHGDTGPNANVRVVIDRNPGVHAAKQPRSRPFGLFMDTDKALNNRSLKEPTEGDWVTETTSDVDLGDDLPTKGIKETGSSIADYSDEGEVPEYPFPSRLGSRDPILQHPSGEALGESYEMHNLKGTNQRVLVPRPQLPRFNGFGQNSSRLGPYSPRRRGSQKGVMNPFRRSYKRADASSYFTFKSDRRVPSKYDFRDSTSTCAPPTESNQTVCGTKGTLPHSMSPLNTAKLKASEADPFTDGQSMPLPRIRPNNYTRGHSRQPAVSTLPLQPSQMPQHEVTEDQEPTPMTAGDGPATTSSKFAFKLLDLSEAQELQRQQRESGETDETEDSVIRYHRACSDASAGANPEALPQPLPAHVRNSHVTNASKLSTQFTLPPWRASRSESPRGLEKEQPLTLTDISDATVYRAGLGGQSEPASAPRNRLLPLDKRVRRTSARRTLRNIMRQDMESIQAAEESFISAQARSRRQMFFYGMLVLSVFPFFSLLALNGKFNGLLAWFTNSEACEMTRKQRKIIKIVFIVEIIILTSLFAILVAYYQMLKERAH